MVTAWRRGHASCITGRRRRGTVSCSCLACSASSFTATAVVLKTTTTIWRLASTAAGAVTTASPESVSQVLELALEQQLPQSLLSDTEHLHLPRTAPSSCCHHGSWLSGRAKEGAYYQQFLQNWFHHRCCFEPLGCLWPCPYLYLCLAAPVTTLRW